MKPKTYDNAPPRVITIHSLAGFGRSSMAVISPVLSALGAQCCPVPTAVLSTHTGGLGKPSCTVLSNQLTPTLQHYRSLNVPFSAIYTGYLGGREQVDSCIAYCNAFPEAFVLVDPVMGDDGAPYRGVDIGLISKMCALCGHADLITPNATEAAMLIGEDPGNVTFETKEQAVYYCRRLSELCPNVVITGAEMQGKKYNLIYSDKHFVRQEIDYIETGYPGTGDLFDAVLLGNLLRGKILHDAVYSADAFVHDCIAYTASIGTDRRFGVNFEPMIHKLLED